MKWKLTDYVLALLVSLIVIFLIIAMAACSSESGLITDKKFKRAYVAYQDTCVAYNYDTGLCISSVQAPVQQPAQYCFRFEGDHFDQCNIPPADWDKYQIGDHYPGAGRG